VYIHHRDEDIGKDPTRLGSRYDFFVWVDEKTCEIKGEGALQ